MLKNEGSEGVVVGPPDPANFGVGGRVRTSQRTI
jgi:hypothetical protein